jgi:N-acetylmuramoyl-L-alanine amidase
MKLTAQMADEIRHRLGRPIRILSAYRNAAYNTCIGGESASYHMQFNALDITTDGASAIALRDIARSVRASNSGFTGGIGLYSTFIHIDTRGYEANW